MKKLSVFMLFVSLVAGGTVKNQPECPTQMYEVSEAVDRFTLTLAKLEASTRKLKKALK